MARILPRELLAQYGVATSSSLRQESILNNNNQIKYEEIEISGTNLSDFGRGPGDLPLEEACLLYRK